MPGYKPPAPVDDKAPLLEGEGTAAEGTAETTDRGAQEWAQGLGAPQPPVMTNMDAATIAPPSGPLPGNYSSHGQYLTPVPGQYTARPPGYSSTPPTVWQPPPMGVIPIPVADVPNASTYWDDPDNRNKLAGFFGLSLMLIAFTLGEGLLILTQVSAVLGMIASGLYLWRNTCAANLDLPSRARYMTALVYAVFILDIFSFVQLAWVGFLVGFECEEDPEDATPQTCSFAFVYTAIVALMLAVHMLMTVLLLKRVQTVQLLLNPVSSGLVV